MGKFVLDLLFVRLRDLIILAVDATQIAVAKENVSGAARSHQCGFFAEVSSVRRDDWQPARVAGRDIVLQPIIETVARTDGATFQQGLQRGHSPRKLSRLE